MNEYMKFCDEVRDYFDYLEGMCSDEDYGDIFNDVEYNLIINQFAFVPTLMKAFRTEVLYQYWLCYGRRLLKEGHISVYEHLCLTLICCFFEESEIRNLAYFIESSMNQMMESGVISELYKNLKVVSELLCGRDFIYITDEKIERISSIGNGVMAFELKKSILIFYTQYCAYNLSHVAYAVQCELEMGCIDHALCLLRCYEDEFCYYMKSHEDYQKRMKLLIKLRDTLNIELKIQYNSTFSYCLARLNYSVFMSTGEPLNRLLMALHLAVIENEEDEDYENKLKHFKLELISDFLRL